MAHVEFREKPRLRPSNAYITAFCPRSAHIELVGEPGQPKKQPNPNTAHGYLAHRMGAWLLIQEHSPGQKFKKPDMNDLELLETVKKCYVNKVEEVYLKCEDPLIFIEESLGELLPDSPQSKADTAIVDTNDIYIFDLKFTDREIEDYQFFQLAVYGFAYLAKYQKDKEVHLIIATPYGTYSKDCHPQNLLAWGQRMLSTWEIAKTEDYPVPGPHCAQCPLCSLCYLTTNNIYRSIAKVNTLEKNHEHYI